MLSRLKTALRALLRRPQAESELDEELRYHIERQIEQNVRLGMTPEEARDAARRAFGGVEQAKERSRDARGVRWVEEFWQDLRYGARTLMKNPGFTLIAVITLALGIGANTAIFSVVNGVLFESLPYPDADRLVVVTEETQAAPGLSVAYPDYLDWKARQSVFENLTAHMVAGGILTGGGDPERVFGRWVSASFFATLGVPPEFGRAFTEAEDRPGGDRVIILSHALWRRRYGENPRLIGQSIEYNGEPRIVVGVTPDSFDFYGQINANNDFFMPLGQLADESFLEKRDSRPGINVLGRMKPGVRLDHAREGMRALAARIATEHPATNAGVGVALHSMLDAYVGGARRSLWMMLAAVALVLLIACANVANLLLSRASARRREIALRMAVGAGRGRIIRQLLTESLLLALGGGAVGLLLSLWGVALLTKYASGSLPRLESITVDWRALGFTLLTTLLTGLIFGLAPALQTTRSGGLASLKEGPRSGASGGRRLREAIVIVEVALSLLLLIGAGLLFRSYDRLTKVDPGFDPRNVLTLRLRLPDAYYREQSQVTGFLRQILPRLSSLPGVESACLTTGIPFGRGGGEAFLIEGRTPPSKELTPIALNQFVSADYHRTFGIALLAGRYFTPQDNASAPPVVIIDEDLARKHFPGLSYNEALGRRLKLTGDGEPWREIVGVVRHIRHNSLDEPQPSVETYGPYEQMNPRWLTEIGRAMDVAVKTSAGPRMLLEAIRREVQALDRGLPLSHVRTMEESIALSVAARRFNLALLGVFAIIALALGAVGIYGVMSYSVAQRTQEIGVRVALGAQGRDVLRLVIGQGMKLALIGSAVGLVAAVALTRGLRTLLFDVSATDPLTFAATASLLAFIALLACWIPAWRAMKVDPSVALKTE
jgi:putative ABC transport system permease protein